MRKIHRSFGLASIFLVADLVTAEETLEFPPVFVKIVQQVEVPARQAGILESLSVREGSEVEPWMLLGKIADGNAALALRRAEALHKSAQHQAEDQGGVNQAMKKLEKERQGAKERALERDVAEKLASNKLRVEAAEKARDVARNELDRARQSRARFIDSVSQSEIERLQLMAERAALDAQQAAFDRGLDQIKARVAEEALGHQQLSIEEAELAIEQSHSEQKLARLNADQREAEWLAAKLQLDQHQIFAPKFRGEVVEVYRREGEWLEPGKPILRIVRLDRLRVEAFTHLKSIKFDLKQAQARIKVRGQGDEPIEVEGSVVFVSPEIDSVNQEVRIWVEFENPDMKLRPGMQGTLRLQPSEEL